MRLAKSRYEKNRNRKKASFKKKLKSIGGKPTEPRAKKGEKILKSVHELNKGLKEVTTAVGKKVKDVSREVPPAKRKLQKDIRSKEVNEACGTGSDVQDLVIDECAKKSKEEKEAQKKSKEEKEAVGHVRLLE